MNRLGIFTGIAILSTLSLLAAGRGENRGTLGPTSVGIISLSLEINEDVYAGFLKSGLGSRDPRFRKMLSTQLVQTIKQDADMILPLCIISAGGAYFEVTLVDVPGGYDMSDEEATPLAISFGEKGGDSLKYRATQEECNIASAIPVTIHLNRGGSGNAAGTIYGRINLLIKRE